jgi:hypothetical protein
VMAASAGFPISDVPFQLRRLACRFKTH